MTAVSHYQPPGLEGAGVNFARVFRSEWTKFSSLRSSAITLAIAAVLMVGLGAAISAGVAAAIATETGPRRIAMMATLDGATVSLNGILLAQIAIGVLGVLTITGEYSGGMIRATFAAVPRRVPVLVAKALLVFLVTVITMIPISAAAFLVGQYFLADTGISSTLADPEMVRAVIGGALYLGVIGVLGLVLGALLRSPAGSIATLVGVLTVLPGLARLVPLDWVQQAADYLPSTAGEEVYRTGLLATGELGPWLGFAVMAAYAVVGMIVTCIVLVRRDA